MGKVQCVSMKGRSDSFLFIEKYLRNINTPLERKMHDEYYHLKEQLRTNKSLESELSKDKDSICNKAKTKMEKFIKWYQMVQFDHSNYKDNRDNFNYNSVGSVSDRSSKSKCITPVKNKDRDLSLQASYNSASANVYSKYEHDNHHYDSNLGTFPMNGNKLDNISQIWHTESDYNDTQNYNDYHSEIDKSSSHKVSNFSSVDIETHTISMCPTLKSNQIEKNLKKFFQINRAKFIERVVKGPPPESLRWVIWLILGNIPSDREEDLFLFYFNSQVDEKVDIQIKKDLNRTLSDLVSFNIEEAQKSLYKILRAFSNNDKVVSYCQGMNFIVGFLLILSDFNECEAFYMMMALFSETFGDNLGIRGFFSEDFPLLKAYLYIFDHFFAKKMPELREHFQKLDIIEEIWIAKWFQTLFTICLPFDILVRVWDCIMSYGLDFLISFSLALVKGFETEMLKFTDAFDVIEHFKNMGSVISGTTGKINLDVEEIINNAIKLRISKSEIDKIKTEYENKFKIDLSTLKVKYEISSSSQYSSERQSFNSSKNNNYSANNNSKVSGKLLVKVDPDLTKALTDVPSKKSTTMEDNISGFDKTGKSNFFGETYTGVAKLIEEDPHSVSENIADNDDSVEADYDTLDGDVSNTIDTQVNSHKFNLRRVSLRGNFNDT